MSDPRRDPLADYYDWRDKHAADVAYWTDWAQRFPKGMVPSEAFLAVLAALDATPPDDPAEGD